MPKKSVFILLTFAFLFSFKTNAYADFSCSASVTPSSTTIDAYTEFNFQISNTGSTKIDWVGVRPENNFQLVGFSSDWTGEVNNGEVYFRNGSISSSESKTFGVNASAGSEITTATWVVEAAEDYGGEMISCGTAEVIISEYQESAPTPTSAPGVTTASIPTQAPGVSVTSAPSSRNSSSSDPVPVPTPKPLDKTAPKLSISFDSAKAYTKSPLITGKASDTGIINAGISAIEYSVDDGKNWIPVDNIKSIGKNGALNKTFEFTPYIVEDGNYLIKARAIDRSGNIGFTEAYKLVFDKLPPRIGGYIFSVGPQELMPNSDEFYLLKDMNHKITLSAIGGPISINLDAYNKSSNNPKNKTSKFGLNKNQDNGLWSGNLSFDEEGRYDLTAISIDGADNQVKKRLSRAVVLSPGKVISGEEAVKDAEISVFYFNEHESGFVLWGAEAFGQMNPQLTNANGEYKIFLPPGKFYLQIKAKGKKLFKSNIFTIEKSAPINENFELENQEDIRIWKFIIPFPDFKVTSGNVNPPKSDNFNDTTSDLDLVFPDVTVKDGSRDISTGSFIGRPYLVTILNTWLPTSSEQIKYLEKISKSENFKAVVIVPQESPSKVETFKKIGEYALPIYSDYEGKLIDELNLQNLPAHIFLDRTGKIKIIKTGVLTDNEIIKEFK